MSTPMRATAPCWYDPDTDIISISFKYDPEFVKDCQRIAGRKWDDANKVNTFPITSAADVKVLVTKWSIPVDETLKVSPQWDSTPPPSSVYNVFTEGKSIIMNFAYQKEIVDTIHDAVPGATWISELRRWQTSIEGANDAVAFAKIWGWTVEPNLLQSAEQYLQRADFNYELSAALETQPFSVPGLDGSLRPYQFPAVEYTVQNNRVIIADDMGLGKSLESMSVMMIKDALPCVIVCKSKLKGTWQEEVWKWFPGSSAAIINGTNIYPIPPVDFVILNYDISHAWYDHLIERGFKSLIVDESHYIKNGKRSFMCSGCGRPMRSEYVKKCPECREANVKAKRKYNVRRTHAVMQLSLSLPDDAPVIVLTGTPLEHRPRELIRQLECIDRLSVFGGENKFKFRYCGINGKGASNSIELNRKLRENCYVRRRINDVYKDLPPEQYIPQFLEIPEKSMQRYREVERDVVEYFAKRAGEEARARGDDATWAEYCKRQQLERVKDIVQLSGLRSVLSEIKLEPIIDWIKDFDEDTGGEEKLVVFGEHIALVDHIYNQFPGESVGLRGMSSVKAQNNATAFQTNPAIKKWIANLQASKEGFTLTAASHVAFCELPWSPMWMSQGLGRCLKGGQLVHTDRGMIPVENVLEGDKVMTHDGRWCSVDGTSSKKYRGKMVELEYSRSNAPLVVTPEHRVWVKDFETGEIGWKEARDIKSADYVAFPRSVGPGMQELKIPTSIYGLNAPRNPINKDISVSNDLLWAVGRFLGDGWVHAEDRNGARIIRGIGICGHSDELEEVERALEIIATHFELPWSHAKTESQNSCSGIIYSVELGRLFDHWFLNGTRDGAGRGSQAAVKRIPGDWMITMNQEQAWNLLNGYMSADGSYMSDGRCRWSSVSPHLGWQFNQLVARCGFDPVITKSTKRSHNVGRDIWLGHYNARDKTVIRVDLRQSDDEYVWNPITRKREVEYEGTVYDLSVEDANSFVVEGATVHNCRGRANDPHHAIGHVLLVHGTLDEEMWAMLDEKRGVIDAVRDGIEVPEDQMTVEEQLRLAWMDRGKRVIDLL